MCAALHKTPAVPVIFMRHVHRSSRYRSSRSPMECPQLGSDLYGKIVWMLEQAHAKMNPTPLPVVEHRERCAFFVGAPAMMGVVPPKRPPNRGRPNVAARAGSQSLVRRTPQDFMTGNRVAAAGVPVELDQDQPSCHRPESTISPR
jgi:hypothetical protein